MSSKNRINKKKLKQLMKFASFYGSAWLLPGWLVFLIMGGPFLFWAITSIILGFATSLVLTPSLALSQSKELKKLTPENNVQV